MSNSKNKSTTTINHLSNLNLDENSTVILSYSEGTDVFVHNESEVETALENTSVVEAFARLVTTPGLSFTTQYGDDPLETLRESDLLEDYSRDFTFAEYVCDVIKENFYDADLIEYHTEKYDYKRGFCTLTASLQIPAERLIEAQPDITGWDVKVKTCGGVLTLNG